MKRIFIIGVIVVAAVFSMLVSCGGKETKWQRFSSRETTCEVPVRWVKNDPFCEETAYWNYLWCRLLPPKDARVALFRSRPADQNQFFVMLGPRDYFEAELDRCLSRFDNDPKVQSINKYEFTTADGVDVVIYAARSKPVGMDTEDVTYLLGFADLGGDMFVINGGGRSARFDINLIEKFIESLNLGSR